MNVGIIDKSKCTGCGMCTNICAKKAIHMGEDSENFLFPIVDEDLCNGCGLCYSRCPINYVKNDNNENPTCFSVRASEFERRKSSSGGVFGVLANKILSCGGYVCGAVFDKQFRLHHIVSNNYDDVERMRGSKYLQSRMDNVYEEISELLKDNKTVLFTGTPCEIAGLYCYIGSWEKYNNLYTIDIICHGVPSQNSFDLYLCENHDKNINKVLFRDKTHGWRADIISVIYEDGNRYERGLVDDLINPPDSYEIGFQKNIFLRKSCENCSFCSFPRQGNISIGDFWGISAVDPSENDGIGTSMVFVNNMHGMELLDLGIDELKIKEQHIDYMKIPNRIMKRYPAHKNRNRFFDLINQGFKFNTAVDYVYRNKYDIGIVGIYTVENFGGALTYFALYNVIKSMGYSVLMIERPMSAEHKPATFSIYYNDPYSDYEKAKLYNNKNEMMELNDICNTFVVGSDQMFNNYLYKVFDKWVTLDWVNDNRKKIAYAASFGHDYIWHPEDTRAEMSYYMKKFDAFSVREKSGVSICDKDFGIAAEWVLDPVFLCDRSNYDKLINEAKQDFPNNYVGAYILDLNYEKEQILKKICAIINLNPVIYSEMNYVDNSDVNWPFEIKQSTYINDRLKCIAQSDFFVADSFHGICFAIIYRKNFIAILNNNRGADRFYSLLNELDLSNRIITSSDELADKLVLEPIDYDRVYNKLNLQVNRCKEWLVNALLNDQKKSFSDSYYLKKYSIEQEKKYNQLKKKNEELNRKIDAIYDFISEYIDRNNGLISSLNSKLKASNIDDIYHYLSWIKACKNEYLMILAVCDNIGCRMNSRIAENLCEIGFDLDWNNENKRRSYVAILNEGKVIFCENNVEKETTCSIDIAGIQIEVESRLYKLGNCAHIKINKMDYAINRRGLNFVIYNLNDNKLIDSVCFDTHVDAMTCIREV